MENAVKPMKGEKFHEIVKRI